MIDGGVIDVTPYRHGLRLRPVEAEDQPLLRALYADLRADELAGASWPSAQKTAFLDSQFDLQHRHFTSLHPGAEFWLIEVGEDMIGRFYVDRSEPLWRVLDLGLFARARGRGVGEALIRWVQGRAADEGREGVDLHVAVNNPRALALYARMGFVEIGEPEGFHRRMVWRASSAQLKTA